MGTPLLKLDNVTVSFSGFKALNNLSFAVAGGGAKILIGPNGSGKTTLLDTITGKVRPVSGRVIYKGKDITNYPEHRIAQMGIRRKFQTPGVLGNLTVRNNLALAVRREKNLLYNLRPGLSAIEEKRVFEVLELIKLTEKTDRLAAELSHGEKQWLEIGMVVVGDPELILLDEPTAGMTSQEVNETALLIKKLTEKQTVLVIDHDMSFVEKLEGTVSVLHMGSLIKEGDIQTIRQDPEVISVYLGRPREALNARA
jgi:urea transport system ATP-binding protein